MATPVPVAGVVTVFVVEKGYGFIVANNRSVFFHLKHVKEGYVLKPGDRVRCVVGPSENHPGKLQCFDIEFLDRVQAVQQ